jgi:N-acetylated-alpha-linked acidic dipeptidase
MRHRRLVFTSTAMAGVLFAAGVAGAMRAHAAEASLLGFSPAGAAKEQAIEKTFDAGLSAETQRAWLKEMAAKANQVGSPHDKENAEWMLGEFKRWGWDARIETFDVLYPTPIAEKLELFGDHPFVAKLHEPPVEGDATSAETENVLPPYLAYQGDGDVTAEVVYANYGMPDDYKTLARAGIDVKGKIVITRYGGGWRGLKPQLAQEHGAVGCLIYSDPGDDGYGPADPYPKGGTRPPDGVQRGSVQEMMIYPGDPLTPGVGATKDAKRLTRETAPTILKIPALPISYADAQPLLEALTGPVAPKNFRGQLPITYHLGPSTAKAHLLVKSDWSLKPVYDVIAVMKGSEYPNEWVVRGNHHDGWVFGAWDPLAGNVALLNEAKSIGELAKTGWKPKRTIVYASWDGEEPGLIGSTEWAEAHAAELQKKAVLYVNSDTNGKGFLGAEASHDLQRFVNQVAADVPDPETKVSVQARLRAGLEVRGLTDPRQEKEAKIAAKGGDLPVGALGSGSDYSAFLQHLGLATINLGFGGEDEQGGVYHSAYDTYEHYARFGDPTFEYGVALSKVSGRLVLRAADAEVLPLHFTGFAETVSGYVEELKKLNADLKAKSEAEDRLLGAGAFKLAADPAETEIPPPAAGGVPSIDFSALDSAVKTLKASAKAYDDALAAAGAVPAVRAAKVNALIGDIDQTLLDPEGLPGRPWFKNLAYAPGVLTGYGAKTLPGVREAIEGRRWAEAQAYVGKTAKVLTDYAAHIDAATAALTKS